MTNQPLLVRKIHTAQRSDGKTIVTGAKGYTRQTMAEQILSTIRERAALMGTPDSLLSNCPFAELPDADRSMLYGVADLFIDRFSRVVHAVEFYRDASRKRLLDDHGETARRALAGKLP